MSVLRQLGRSVRLSSQVLRPLTRGYGSAVAQLDYDYYSSDEELTEGKVNVKGMVDLEDWETVGRGVQWVIMGDPTVKRHMYAERLAKLLDVPHISMGTLVRQELNPNSPLYKKIASSVNQGKLVPEDVIFGLLSKRLEEGFRKGETGFILDGIPRTQMQAEILDEIADVDLVLNLKCTEEFVGKKSVGNGLISATQEFHLQSSGANSDAIWTEKLRMYAEQKKPVEEYYKRQKKLLDFQIADAPGDTWKGLLTALQLQHMNAVTSASNLSQKLTA